MGDTIKYVLCIILVILCSTSLCFSFGAIEKKQIEKIEDEVLLEKTVGDASMKFVKPQVFKDGIFKRALTMYGMVETGIDNKLLVLNTKGEFSYLDLTDPSKPRLEVISPGFPGVDGMLGSDAENRVAWLARGRGIYMIDLDTKKTGHMIAGNYGQLDRVLMTDKERLLFIAITFSGKANILYAYELSTGTDYGEIMATRPSYFYTLGNNTIMYERKHPTNPALTGWFLTDSLFEEITERKARAEKPETEGLYPGEMPLTKALTEKKVEGVATMFQKQLHQGTRRLYGRISVPGTNRVQPLMVRWSEDFKEVDIEPLLLQKANVPGMYNKGPTHISADGNWLTGIRSYIRMNPKMEELVVFHLQDQYPQGMSMPISLGYTNKDRGAFLNHSTLGPLYVEAPYTRADVLLVYKLTDGLEILKEQALSAIGK